MFLNILEISYNSKATIRRELEVIAKIFERQMLFIFCFQFDGKFSRKNIFIKLTFETQAQFRLPVFLKFFIIFV